MCGGDDGKYGKLGKVEASSYGIYRSSKGSNPCLSATLRLRHHLVGHALFVRNWRSVGFRASHNANPKFSRATVLLVTNLGVILMERGDLKSAAPLFRESLSAGRRARRCAKPRLCWLPMDAC